MFSRPATTSTRGTTWGGLKGWPITQRSGCLHADCITLMVNPEELDAMIESVGGRIVHVREQLYLEVLAFGAVLLNKVGVRERLLHIGGELQMVARCVRRKPDHGAGLSRRRQCNGAGFLPRSALDPSR